MISIFKNHNYVNEVQTISQLFFTGEKFIVAEELPTALGVSIETEIGDNATARVYDGGQLIAEHSISLKLPPINLPSRRVLMLALYHALQKVKPTHTPWGALTGIRPSKMVREWLDTGWSDHKILQAMQDPLCCTLQKAELALQVAKAESAITTRIFEAPNPVGIYISVPFCPTRCAYCSFNVNHNYGDIFEEYVNALLGEIKTKGQQKGVSSIYIGGGTPTVLPLPLLEKLLDAIATTFDAFSPCVEYTVEAGRPDTLTRKKLQLLRKYGVNRIAVNPQTLNDHTLTTIGRKHTAADFFAAFALAREYFPSINTDVIAGLPGETADDMRRTMEGLAALSPENITVHTLAIKRASFINETKSEYLLPTGQVTEEMLDIAYKTCTCMGLAPYYLYRQKNMVGMLENVGYSKPGHECQYNVGMMAETQTILGYGAGAVSKFVQDGKITREFNAKNPVVYVERRTAYAR